MDPGQAHLSWLGRLGSELHPTGRMSMSDRERLVALVRSELILQQSDSHY